MSFASTFRVALFSAVIGFASGPSAAHAAIYNSFTSLNQADEFALDATFSSVGLFVGTDANGANFAAGSGVLIDPYWVLTAGHVTFDGSDNTWASMRFNLSPNVIPNQDQFVGAAAWYTFPGYTPDTPAGKGNDLALIRLSQPVFTVAPAQRFYGEDQEGTVMTMAGYGRPGVWPNEGAFDAIRRGGQNIGDSFGNVFGVSVVESQYWVADFDSAASQNPFPLEWQGSNVDSGGGWFAEIGGDTYLVGITNGGLATNTASFALRTSLYNDWIDETIAVNTVPEPTSMALFGMGLLGLGARRMRKHSIALYPSKSR